MKTGTRYLLVGIWNSIFGVVNFLVFSTYFPVLNDTVLLALSYSISIIHAHFTQRHFVWQSSARYLPELTRFSVSYLAQFILNLVLFVVSAKIFDVSRNLRQLGIVLFLTIFFFFINKRKVFQKLE